MTMFHDYKRTVAITHNIHGADWEFALNEVGHAVCDITDEAVAERLLQIPEGFRPYDPSELPAMSPVLALVPGNTDPEASPYVLVSGDASFDLRPLSDDDLRGFAAENGIAIPNKAKGDTIRDKIVAALKAPE